MVLTRMAAAALALALAAPGVARAQAGAGDAWLGFSVDPGPPPRVREVAPGSPAEEAGLVPGDTLLRIGGRPATFDALSRAARQAAPGQALVMEVRRRGVRTVRLVAGRRWSTAAALGVAPSLQARAAPVRTAAVSYLQRAAEQISVDCPGITEQWRPPSGDDRMGLRITVPARCFDAADSAGTDRLRGPNGQVFYRVDHAGILAEGALSGVELLPLGQPLAAYFPGVQAGLLVLRVTAGLPAAQAGLQPGDVVTAIKSRPVRDRATLAAATAGAVRLRLAVVRHGRRISLTVPRTSR